MCLTENMDYVCWTYNAYNSIFPVMAKEVSITPSDQIKVDKASSIDTIKLIKMKLQKSGKYLL